MGWHLQQLVDYIHRVEYLQFAHTAAKNFMAFIHFKNDNDTERSQNFMFSPEISRTVPALIHDSTMRRYAPLWEPIFQSPYIDWGGS